MTGCLYLCGPVMTRQLVQGVTQPSPHDSGDRPHANVHFYKHWYTRLHPWTQDIAEVVASLGHSLCQQPDAEHLSILGRQRHGPDVAHRLLDGPWLWSASQHRHHESFLMWLSDGVMMHIYWVTWRCLPTSAQPSGYLFLPIAIDLPGRRNSP